jgi:hypothetical protein
MAAQSYSGQPADHSKEPGRSWPMGSPMPRFKTMVVGIEKNVTRFIDLDSDKLDGKFLVILFMDNRLSQEEVDEWQAFSAALKEFKYGDSHIYCK